MFRICVFLMFEVDGVHRQNTFDLDRHKVNIKKFFICIRCTVMRGLVDSFCVVSVQ